MNYYVDIITLKVSTHPGESPLGYMGPFDTKAAAQEYADQIKLARKNSFAVGG